MNGPNVQAIHVVHEVIPLLESLFTTVGQCEIIKHRWVAERDEEGTAILCRVRTVNRLRFDIELRARRMRYALVNEVALKDVRGFRRFLVVRPPLGPKTDRCLRP